MFWGLILRTEEIIFYVHLFLCVWDGYGNTVLEYVIGVDSVLYYQGSLLVVLMIFSASYT